MPGETRNHQHFLGKFVTLRQFFRSPEVIRRLTCEAIADAAADNVKYLELRFTPPALSNIIKCAYEDVIAWVCDAAMQAVGDHDIQVSLIISMNRHEGAEVGYKVLQAALPFVGCVAALDLAGNESQFPAHPFYDVFEQAKTSGFGVTIHAGEWLGADSVHEAIEHLHADRIGHGVRSIESPDVLALLAENGTALEVCPSSNYDSGVVKAWEHHPLPDLYRQQIRTTINTDDPLISGITMSDELIRAMNYLSLTLDDLKQHILNAARAAFLPDDQRAALVTKFEHWLNGA
jgi:adenosine deaminase